MHHNNSSATAPTTTAVGHSSHHNTSSAIAPTTTAAAVGHYSFHHNKSSAGSSADRDLGAPAAVVVRSLPVFLVFWFCTGPKADHPKTAASGAIILFHDAAGTLMMPENVM